MAADLGPVDIRAIAIGDELYRYVEVGGIFRYIVQGIRQYEGEVQLEVECQTCTHGWKCRLLVALSDWGRLFHVHMLNDDEDGCREQRMWHTNDGYHFWPTVEQARSESYKRAIEKAKAAVTDAESTLAERKRRLAELETLLRDTP